MDFLYDQANDVIYVGEINTIPGSLSYYLWEQKGISFSKLLDRLIEYAFQAAAERNANVFSYTSPILNGASGAKGGKR